MSRTSVAGVVSLIAVAALGAAANPASAGRPVRAPQAAADSCVGWKNAGSAPLKWTKASDACGHFGAEGMTMVYAWKVFRGGGICVRVKGFDARRKEIWSDQLCGKSGSVRIHWGNVAAAKEIQVKGGPSLLRWN
ncbi:hypothetical protein ACFVZH_14725 [Streptomyces sp. NPDC059534]|uniref:hypothetical protein n=1 Tax=Streptomyces sp. NPDC059534 TaxID=3346859 RepID=UPI0036C0E548